jgi:hypothetical protein
MEALSAVRRDENRIHFDNHTYDVYREVKAEIRAEVIDELKAKGLLPADYKDSI